MNIIPKVTEIHIERKYFDGILDSTTTASPKYYWEGYMQYSWLCFEFKRKFIEGKHFSINEATRTIEFKKYYKHATVFIEYESGLHPVISGRILPNYNQ
jgi:hypothetical protein